MATQVEKIVENAKATVKKNYLQVEPNKKYLIRERITDGTPSVLKEHHKSKFGAEFEETIPIPFIDNLDRYDTGLNVYSSEFAGKSSTEINKILKDRADLVNHLEYLVKSSGLTEKQFLSGEVTGIPYRLKVKHNLILDTTHKDTYLKLFLALRSGFLMPSSEKGNIGRYSQAMYIIEGLEDIKESKGQKALMQGKVVEWFMANYDTNKSVVEKVLNYTDILPVGQSKDKGILLQSVMIAIDDFETLERLHNTIENVSQSEIDMVVAVKKAILKGVIRRDKGNYTYEGMAIGSSIKAVVAKLETPEFSEIGDKIFNTK